MMAEVRNIDDDPRYRLPPHDFEVEQALLGAVLLNNRAHEAAAHLQPEHFADPLHGRIWDAASRLIARSMLANANTLRALFEQDEQLLEKGGHNYLGRLVAAAVSVLDAADYAKIIHDRYLRRELIKVGTGIANAAWTIDLDKPATTQIADAERKLFDIGSEARTQENESVYHVSAIVDRTIQRIERAHQNKGIEGRVRSGLTLLDGMLVLAPGDFCVLAGAASMGKSALLDCFLDTNSQDGQVGLLDNREMTPEQLVMRRLARRTGINVERQQLGQIEPGEWTKLMEAGEAISAQPLYIADNPSMTPSGLRSEIRRLKRRGPLHAVGVDYMQLMVPDTKNPKFRSGEVSEITRALRLIAREEQLVMFGLSQLSRLVDGRDDHRPNMGDLRESGSIEQDATHVVFVYREEYYLGRHEPKGKHGKPADAHEVMDWMTRVEAARGVAELIVAKSRNGSTGTRRVAWDGPLTRFHDINLETPGGPIQGSLGSFEPQ